MKKKVWLLIPVALLLTACNTKGKGSDALDQTCYAFFMNNYPRVTEISPNGNEIKTENTLYERKKIEPGVPFSQPEKNPEREDHEFQGWFKEKACLNVWNFETDTTDKTVYLFAKWSTGGDEDFVEPEYVYPETIITDADFRLKGIFNIPTNAGEVDLTIGMINRLEQHPEDVKFAISYERRQNVTFTATYNPSTKVIHIQPSAGDAIDVHVNDVTDSYRVSNTYYEQKADAYETKGTTYENYHIALAGSSSMENWSSSDIDMAPIVTFNHGIGGTTVDEWNDALFRRLVLPYLPKAVVYYVGVNNIINGDHEEGAAVGEKLKTLFDTTHQYLPNTQIFYVLINKLPGFANKQGDFDAANNKAINYANNHSYVTCIDAGKGLLKEDGTPNAAYFLTDGLHMSKFGYVIWGAEVKQAIKDWLKK